MSSVPLHPVMFRALWAYRGFVLGSVRREFESRFRGSLFGALWAVLNPLAMIVVYTVVFATIMRPQLPGHDGNPWAYSVYLCAGLLPWTLFAEVVQRMTTVFIDNGNLIKKSSFPRICLPVVVVLSAALNFAVIAALFLVFLVAVGAWPGAVALAALPVLAVQLAFAAGLGLLLGTLNVFFRDVGQATGVLINFWFWLTPIVYVASTLPPAAAELLAWNPMTAIAQAYQGIFVDARLPAWGSLGAVAALAGLLLVAGGLFFLRQSGELVDEL